MNFIKHTLFSVIGIGLLTLMVLAPLIQAQRQQQAPFQRGEPAPRREPMRAPVEERRPVVVDRVTHGTLRHVDTQVVERPVVERHEAEVRPHAMVHRDVEVDIDHQRHWHDFVFGRRVNALRAGYLQLLVNGDPFFYDDGIYYQQANDGYLEVYPPVGAVVPVLPAGAIEIAAGNLIYYSAGGAFYVQQYGGFAVAPPPLGVTVPELPPGAVPVSLTGRVVYQFNGIYYQPAFVNGVTQFVTVTP